LTGTLKIRAGVAAYDMSREESWICVSIQNHCYIFEEIKSDFHFFRKHTSKVYALYVLADSTQRKRVDGCFRQNLQE